MHWLWDAMWVRIGWALGELVLAVSVVAIVISVLLICAWRDERKKARLEKANEQATEQQV